MIHVDNALWLLMEKDPTLNACAGEIRMHLDRFNDMRWRLAGEGSLSDFANGHRYFGFHRTETGWVFREWLPGADAAWLMGDFNDWDRYDHPLNHIGNGVWEIALDGWDALKHGQFVKLMVGRQGTSFERIPAWITLVFLAFSLLLLVFILMNANRIFGGELVLFSRKKAMKNSIEDLNRNLKDVFHSEKNLMFSMMILADGVKAEYGTPEGLEKLERLRAIAQSRMEIITSSLNRIRELQLSAAPVDMRRMMDQALADITLPEGIRCEKRYCDFPARCVIDEYHTRSAVKNLFANAVDALQLSDRPDKKITVSVDASRLMALCSTGASPGCRHPAGCGEGH